MEPLLAPRVVTALSLSLLFAGLLVDLTTVQTLVIAIIYNIPIALSGLALSRTLSLWTMVLAFSANIAAGYENSLLLGSLDTITLLNRGLAALSFLIVGALTLAFTSAAERAAALIKEGDKGERERALRDFTNSLSGALVPHDLFRQASEEVLELLDADAVVITHLDGERFAEPRYSRPEATTLAAPGTLAAWALDTLPVTNTPVITVRSDEGVLTVGRWRQRDAEDILIVAARPKVDEASVMLGEALKSLEPLLVRARAFEDLEEP